MQKLSLQQLPNIFKDVVTASYDSTLNKLTLTSVKGDELEIELSPKDNFVLDVTYNSTTHKIKVDFLDGTSANLDLADLYNIYTGVDGTQVKIEVDSDNKIKASIKENAITRTELAKAVTDELDKIVDEPTIDSKISRAVANAAASASAPSSELGDMAIMEINRTAESFYQLRGYHAELAPKNKASDFDEDLADGYVFSGQSDAYRHRKFNRIKVEVVIPGLVRIGVVNKNILKAKPRYSDCLVKWLVVRFAAYTGLKEYDIEDTVLGDDEFIFVECRVGISGCYQNTTSADVVDGVFTLPANSCTTGAAVCPGFDSNANGTVFKSNSLITASARPSYSGYIKSSKTAKLRGGWRDINDYQDEISSMNYGDTAGDLNIGIYEKGTGSDEHPYELLESANHRSSLSNRSWYAYLDNSDLVGKKVYALKIDVATRGTMSVARMKPDFENPENTEIKEIYTHFFRSLGLNQWNLPKEIILEEGEILAVQGYCKDMVPANYKDEGNEDPYYKQTTCQFHYIGTGTDYFEAREIEEKHPTHLGWWTITSDAEGNITGFSHDPEHDINGYPRYLNIDFVVKGDRLSKLEGIVFSITGDSITTYAGEITRTDDVPAGNQAGNNAVYYPAAGQVNNMLATYWGILTRDKRMRFLRNDAWSGSRVTGTESTTSSSAASSTVRCGFLRNFNQNTYEATFDYGTPHLILNCIGTNDLSGGVDLGTINRTNTYKYDTILGAFSAQCCKLRSTYPEAKIVHYILPRGAAWSYANGKGVYMSQLAEEMEKVAKAWGEYFIPLSYFGKLNPALPHYYRYNGTYGPCSNIGPSTANCDMLHPSVQGMEVVAEGISAYLETIFY